MPGLAAPKKPKAPKPPKVAPTPVQWQLSNVRPLRAGEGALGAPQTPAHGGGFGATAPGAPITNTAEVQPDMRFALDELKKRYGGDMGAGRATDLAGGKIREAALGITKARNASQTMRGVSGTGAGYNQHAADADNVLNDIAGAASGIASDAERRREGVLGQILGGGGAAGNLAQGDRSLALQHWTAAQSNQRAMEQAQLARQMALLNLLNQEGN